MTKVWRDAGKITVRRTAMTRWGVIARTRGNAPATGTVEWGKPEGEGKAGKEERKNPALSRRRKIFSVICG
jgi:hypothetical protein